ncbi:MAG: hypothetical protein ACOCRK_09870 [bacterium]
MALLRRSCIDIENIEEGLAPFYGHILYCARRRGLRPQNAWYNITPRQIHYLFDNCGEKREIDELNPKERKL